MRRSHSALRIFTWCSTFCVWLSPLSVAFAQQKGPVYGNVRYEDDYSSLGKDGNRGTDPFNRLKLIPAFGKGELTLGGNYRIRFEHDDNRRFGASNPQSQSFYLNRVYLFADVQMSDRFRLFDFKNVLGWT